MNKKIFINKNKPRRSFKLRNLLNLLLHICLYNICKIALENAEQRSACLLLKRYSQFLL